jgi:RHS repeat-associated protein
MAPFRVYDAELGRWLSRDPMESITGDMAELVEDTNLYNYVGNDPLSWIDDDGLNRRIP